MIHQEIYKKGGRKYVFLGLPPAGCAPYIIALIPGNKSACMEELTILAKLHNRALSKVLLKLESQLKGFKYSVADFYSFFIERISSPSEYGMSLSLAFIAHNQGRSQEFVHGGPIRRLKSMTISIIIVWIVYIFRLI